MGRATRIQGRDRAGRRRDTGFFCNLADAKAYFRNPVVNIAAVSVRVAFGLRRGSARKPALMKINYFFSKAIDRQRVPSTQGSFLYREKRI
jgi:hypothetical protein